MTTPPQLYSEAGKQAGKKILESENLSDIVDLKPPEEFAEAFEQKGNLDPKTTPVTTTTQAIDDMEAARFQPYKEPCFYIAPELYWPVIIIALALSGCSATAAIATNPKILTDLLNVLFGQTP